MMRAISADTVRRQVRAAHRDKSYADIGRELDLSDEFVRMVLLGKREPSKAFLRATGYERVVMYRKRAK